MTLADMTAYIEALENDLRLNRRNRRARARIGRELRKMRRMLDNERAYEATI